ncbi:MAG: hypothetical protein QOE05_447 [Actinomycetota bacterium]|jgi:hypothetical protein|nr:hypothetical protein [Actinomycetota bacterium]
MWTIKLLLLGVALGALPAQAEEPLPTIQPGMSVTRGGEPWCTGGFVFDGVGRRLGQHYLGIAAHCFESSIGQVVHDATGAPIGRVAYSHWPYTSFADDVALIQLDPSVWPRTDPTMAGFPGMPTRVADPAATGPGDLVGVSGWGTATQHDQRTREGRRGVLSRYGDGLWGAELLVSNGDSGGPVVAVDDGAAVGSVSNPCVPVPLDTSDGYQPGCVGYGPSTAQLIARATADGFPVVLRTANRGRVR